MTNEKEDWRTRLSKQKDSEKAGGSKRTFVEVRSTIDDEMSSFEKAIMETAEKVQPKVGKIRREELVVVANIIAGVRKNTPVTQQALADKVGLTVTGYANIERGDTAPSWETLQKICKALQIKITINGIEI